MRLLRLLVALLVVAPWLAAQDASVEVLTVRNRPAEDLVPALQPLAGADGSVMSMDNRLIVRATPEALRQIKAVLQELDVAPRSLWITVRQVTTASATARSAGVTGSVPIGDGGVRVTRDGGTVTTTRSRTVVSGSFGASSSTETGGDVSRILALEGRPAFIEAGRAVVAPPIVAEAATGFWVLPRIAGELAVLELATTRDAFGPGATIDQRHTRTTLSARLGDWVHVGGIGGDSASRTTGIGSIAGASSTTDWSVDLKVEAAPGP
jgi:type II secretory pathway component HofQ